MTDNFRASLLMVLTMAGFTLEDMFIKLASERVPIGQIILLLGIGGTAVMAAMVRAAGQSILHFDLRHPAFLIRTGCEGVGWIFGMSALALLPLSLVSALGQSAPILATLGAALFLGERVGWRRWLAVLVGLAGVLLIVQPAGKGFQPAVLLSVLAVVFLAVRDLATRRLPQSLTTLQVNFWGYAVTLPASLVLLLVQGKAPIWPETRDWLFIGAAMCLGIVFYYTLTIALRMGESSVVVPFRYTRVVFGLGIGILVFAERPDGLMLAGTLLVVGSGLYSLLREARLRRQARRAAPSQGARRSEV